MIGYLTNMNTLKVVLVFCCLVLSVGAAATDADFQEVFANGRKAYQKQRFDEAIEHFTRCIALQPSNPEGYRWRGNSQAEKENPDRRSAMEDYGKALELDGNNAEVYFSRGLLRSELGEIDSALADYAKALEKNPDYFPALINRSQVLISRKSYDEALRHLDHAASLKTKDDRVYYWRAYTRYYLGDERGAISDFETIKNARIKDVRFFNDYAWLLATAKDTQLRDYPLASKLASRAEKLAKGPEALAKVYDTLATAYEGANQPELAKKYRALQAASKQQR